MNNCKITFDKPLLHATIKSRINRFIFIVDYNGLEVEAHCPSGGTIAGIPRKLMTQLPCLLSDHGDNTTRRTRYTVEAVSLDNGHTYMGINQTASNHYVHHFLQNEDVQSVLNINGPVAREKKLGNSRIDFKVDDTYIEVKTMVAEYYGKASKHLKILMKPQEPSVERMQKHIRELTHEVDAHESKAIMLTVFQYDAPKFEPPVDNPKYKAFINDLKIAKASGVRQVRMNLRITDKYVELLSITENEVI
jgi:sugar fermentation stimulation protein homolog